MLEPDETKPDLLSVEPEEAEALLTRHFEAHGQPSYRTSQTLGWVYDRLALGFEEMTNLPQAERAALADRFRLTSPAVARLDISEDGTAKHLWRMDDGELLESVLIPAGDRLTLCISSQAGCAMGCTFCATGWSGYRRQLTAGEIVAQYRGAQRWAEENDAGRITNVVFMGMGEPLMNRDAVMPALTLLNGGYGLGARRITVSTVGVAPGIVDLAERPEQFRLALSLHAPTRELRERLIPIEKKYPLPDLMAALHRFADAGGRRITFEYIMIDGVNDSPELAGALAELVGEFQSHVNLIPYNPIPGPDWQPSPPDRIRAFADVLEARGLPTTVRTPRGRDIAAACGQLRADHEAQPPKSFVALEELAKEVPKGGTPAATARGTG